MPEWIGRYLNLDTGLRSYQGVIVQWATFSNPIANVFVALLEERNAEHVPANICGAAAVTATGEEVGAGVAMTSSSLVPASEGCRSWSSAKRRVAWRLQLAVTLIRCAQLRQYRSHARREGVAAVTMCEM
jgi:hypothetical protein